jgi:transposase
MEPTQSPSSYQLFVGIDVAAATFTATWMHQQDQLARPVTFDHTPHGMQTFLHRLQSLTTAPATTLIVMEATGSYWIALAVTLHAAGYHVSVVNPAQIHAFGKSRPHRGKTDALDARLITQFAVERMPAPWTPPPAVYHELRQRLTARDALRHMRQHAYNHRHALQLWPVIVESVQAQLDTVISDLDRRMEALEQEIAQILQQGEWAASAALLDTIPGIGPLTAAWLLVTTLNFTVGTSATELTGYAGLAPLPHESGTSIRYRRHLSGGGNARLRTALYMACLSAARLNPMIKTFYDRLRAAGKPSTVARCAAARKLLHLAQAVVIKQQPFDPAYHTHGGRTNTQDEVSRAAQPSPRD